MDQNLAWLTQKTEEPKSNKVKLTFPSHTVNMTELQSNKVATPHFYINPPHTYTGLSPFLAKKFCIPPPRVTQFSESPTPPFNKEGGGVPTMMNPNDVTVVVLKDIILFVRF